MRGIFRTGGRRAAAVVQLLLFTFSASTSLLPCGETTTGRDDHRLSPAHSLPSVDRSVDRSVHQVETDTPSSHVHGHAAHTASDADLTSPSPTTTPADHQRSHDSTCPWVVGCIGMAQLSLDNELRVAEQPRLADTPAGIVMRRVMTDRDIESPPPRI